LSFSRAKRPFFSDEKNDIALETPIFGT